MRSRGGSVTDQVVFTYDNFPGLLGLQDTQRHLGTVSSSLSPLSTRNVLRLPVDFGPTAMCSAGLSFPGCAWICSHEGQVNLFDSMICQMIQPQDGDMKVSVWRAHPQGARFVRDGSEIGRFGSVLTIGKDTLGYNDNYSVRLWNLMGVDEPNQVAEFKLTLQDYPLRLATEIADVVGPNLFCCSGNHLVKIDLQTFEQSARSGMGRVRYICGSDSAFGDLVFSINQDDTLRIYRAAQFGRKAQISLNLRSSVERFQHPASMIFCPDSNQFFVGFSGSIVRSFDLRNLNGVVWQTERWRLGVTSRTSVRQTLRVSKNVFLSCVSLMGDHIPSGQPRGRFVVWKECTGRIKRKFPPVKTQSPVNVAFVGLRLEGLKGSPESDFGDQEEQDRVRFVMNEVSEEDNAKKIIWTVLLRLPTVEGCLEMRFPVALFGLSEVLQEMDETWPLIDGTDELQSNDEEEGEGETRDDFLDEDSSDVEEESDEEESPTSKFYREYVVDLSELDPLPGHQFKGISKRSLGRLVFGSSAVSIRSYNLVDYFVFFLKLRMFRHAYAACCLLARIKKIRPFVRVLKQAEEVFGLEQLTIVPEALFVARSGFTQALFGVVHSRLDQICENQKLRELVGLDLLGFVRQQSLLPLRDHPDFCGSITKRDSCIELCDLARVTLEHLLETKAFTDVRLLVPVEEDEEALFVPEIPSHLSVLVWKSRFVHQMLHFGGRERSEIEDFSRITIHFLPHTILEIMIQFVYSGRISKETPIPDLAHLIQHAEMYQEKELFVGLQPAILQRVIEGGVKERVEIAEVLQEFVAPGSALEGFVHNLRKWCGV